MHIDGACHCGSIRYEAEVDPESVVICHCTDCQTFSGGPYRTSVAAPMSQFRLEGSPKTYAKVADSGRRVVTAFCGDCGTALYSHGEGRDFLFLRVGSARQRAELPPQRQGFCDSAMPWAMNLGELPRVPRPSR